MKPTKALTMADTDEVTVHITVTARLSRRRVADLYGALADAAEVYCGDRVSMIQSDARPPSRRGRPPVSEDIDNCLCCGDLLPGTGGTFARAKTYGWRRRYYGHGSRFVCPECP